MEITSRHRLLLAVMALALLLAGCSKVPLTSLWSLRQFSFESFDPALLRVAMHLPPAYAMPRDALRIDVKITRHEGAVPRHEQFVMHESHDMADAIGLPDGPDEGRWIVLRFEASEVERLRQFRTEMVALKSSSAGKGSLQLGASPRLCRTTAAPPGAPRVASALRWSREVGWVALLRDTDLDRRLKSLDAPVALGSLPAC